MDPLRPNAPLELIEALAALRADKRSPDGRPGNVVAGRASTLREQLRQIVAEMDPVSEASYELTRSRVLHCIVVGQWGGDGLGSDPMYGEVIAALERDFRGNRRLDAMFREAMEQLLATR